MKWVDEWQQGRWSANPNFERDLRKFIRDLPLATRKLMVDFPPGCLVRTREGVSLLIPAPKTIGIVVSYGDPSLAYPLGWVGVVQNPSAPMRAQVVPYEIEVVGFRAGFDSAAMQSFVPETVVLRS